ncbi:MAG: hypothetical protein AAGH87_09860 [Pseudomonadota bacterium]
MEWFNELFDLASVAGGAGLIGGAAGTGVAVLFSGVIMKFLARVISTAVMTGVGYLALLNWLGFEIIPPEDIKIPAIPGIERQGDAGGAGGAEFGGLFAPSMLPNGQMTVPGVEGTLDSDDVILEAEAASEIENRERAYVVRSPFRRGPRNTR